MFESIFNSIKEYVNEQQKDVLRLQKKIQAFDDHINNLSRKFTDANTKDIIKKTHTQISEEISVSSILFNLSNLETDLSKFKYFPDYDEKVELANNTFINRELANKKNYFDKMFEYPLDDEQRRAIISDEVNSLIIAGAGCGKTSTILGKIKYLIEINKILPKEILVMSFSNDSVNDLNKRLKKYNIPIEATTFHKFAHKTFLAKKTIEEHPDFVLTKSIMQYFKEISDIKKQEEILRFFSVDIYNLVDEQEIIQNQFEDVSIETIKSRVTSTNSIKKNITINHEFVRSKEEASIANFLYLNGIQYEYEKPYKQKVINEEGKEIEYKPDFYLPEYDIYIEHFGVNLIDEHGSKKDVKNYKAPQFGENEEDYIKEITLKRETHKKNNTKLLETYSFWNKDRKLIDNLKSLLIENSIKLNPLTSEKIKENYISYVIPEVNHNSAIFTQFINLFKANGYTSFEKLKKSHDRIHKLFFEIVEGIYKEYQRSLGQKIDFNDIINLGLEKVKKTKDLRLKYVIIDEFQDINKGRFDLIKGIQTATGCKIFAVGDDWQSIYRFNGSDVSYFKKFTENFGEYYSRIMYIRHTYRNSQGLIDFAGEFVMKNPAQVKKQLISHADIVFHPIILKSIYSYEKMLPIIIDEIIRKTGSNTDILILTRYNKEDKLYNSLQRVLGDEFIFNRDHTICYKRYRNVKIKFMTCHKAKGLEATNVIVLLTPGMWGFPNTVIDNPMLQSILSEPDQYCYAEERRLFYVAITRAKKYAYIVSKVENYGHNQMESMFAKEVKTMMENQKFSSINNKKK